MRFWKSLLYFNILMEVTIIAMVVAGLMDMMVFILLATANALGLYVAMLNIKAIKKAE